MPDGPGRVGGAATHEMPDSLCCLVQRLTGVKALTEVVKLLTFVWDVKCMLRLSTWSNTVWEQRVERSKQELILFVVGKR